jgi:hypothetical protein
MERGQVLIYRGRRLEIACLSGIAWITDGAGGERIVQGGQRVSIRGKDRICIEAFEPAHIQIIHASASQRFLRGLGKWVDSVNCLKFGPATSS